MISNFVCPLILHVLFAAAIESVSVKILQINLMNGFQKLSDKNKCDINGSDIINFITSKEPDVILWLSDTETDYRYFISSSPDLKRKVVILPILSRTNVRNNTCFDYPENNTNVNCYYSKSVLNSKLKILVLNTLLWIQENKYSKEQFKWLNESLQRAESRQENVIIAGFKAPGSSEMSNGSLNFAQQYNEEIVNLLVEYSSIIKACIFGDEKIDTFRIILNKERQPILPIFISPTLTNNYIRLYTYNQSTKELDNCFVYHQNSSNTWQETYNCKTAYTLTNMKADSWSKVAESLLSNDTKTSKSCLNYSRFYPSEKFCKSDKLFRQDCVKCRTNCFIIYLTKSSLDNCFQKCRDDDDPDPNNGVLYVFGVIVGFVIILFGIVLAVNKVYCIRRGRQRNIFLAPLTLNIQAEIVDDIQNSDVNDKVISKEDNANQIKNSNGFRRTNHEVEQTYNYIRM